MTTTALASPNVLSLGAIPWSREEMVGSLEEFKSVYTRRPFAENPGGMRSPHMFLFWFVLRALKPEVVVESGIWRGQGTWLIEQACPQAEIHCIDPILGRVNYLSKKAKYYRQDFSTIDWTELPCDETLVFF